MFEKKKTTINDIAAAAGVSKTTVSRYLNGKFSLMGEDTRERIRAVIEMANYQPSEMARALKSHRTNMVGVLVADIETPFSSAMINGISQVLSQEGLIPLYIDCGNDPERERAYISDLMAQGIIGIIANTTTYENPALVEVSVHGMPVVLCDRYVKDHTFDIVTTKCSQPIDDILDHVKEQGYTSPILFTQDTAVSSTRKRRQGAFLFGMQKIYGEKDPESCVRVIDINEPEKTAELIEKLVNQNQGEKRMVAIGVNTITVVHLLSVMKKLGIHAPIDAGICGPDDWGWGHKMDWASLMEPGITAFTVNSTHMGRECARILVEKLKNPERDKETISYDSKLIIRQSTLLKG